MNERIIAIQADITTLDVDAIVNAANNAAARRVARRRPENLSCKSFLIRGVL